MNKTFLPHFNTQHSVKSKFCKKHILPLVGIFSTIATTWFLSSSLITIPEGSVGYKNVNLNCTSECKIIFYEPSIHFEWPWERSNLNIVSIKEKKYSIGTIHTTNGYIKSLYSNIFARITINVINLNLYLTSLIKFTSEDKLYFTLTEHIRRDLVSFLNTNNNTSNWNVSEYGLNCTNLQFI